MVLEEVLFASISIAARALPLCAKALVLPLVSGLRSDDFSLVHHHKQKGWRTAFVPAMWNFPCANGFLLIIRGFVKVAVFNADVIHR